MLSARCLASMAAFGLFAACGQSNTYQPPPPPKVTVAKPVEQKVTRYFEATGNTAAVNSANLVARVQGFLTEIKYTDGQPVKKGAHLFTIEPEPYQLKLQQAQINLDYTKVMAPFDGVVTARQVSIGELVGSGGTQVLATIVQLDPIYVNFNASERDVLHVRDMLYKRGQRAANLLGTEVEVGLQTDQVDRNKAELES